jgi:hypothetical protein
MKEGRFGIFLKKRTKKKRKKKKKNQTKLQIAATNRGSNLHFSQTAP